MLSLILTDMLGGPNIFSFLLTGFCFLLYLGSLLVLVLLVRFKVLNIELVKYWTFVAIPFFFLFVYLVFFAPKYRYHRGLYFTEEEYKKKVDEDDSLYHIRQMDDSLNLPKSKSDSTLKTGK